MIGCRASTFNGAALFLWHDSCIYMIVTKNTTQMKIEGKTFKSVSPDAPMAAKLMEQARKYGNDFITGWPIQLLRYGRRSDRTISFATYQTENGIEDLIAADTFQDAIDQTAMIFEVKR